MRPRADAAAPPTLATVYETDKTGWLEESARLIRAGRRDELDYDHLAVYLEYMANRDRREVDYYLETLLVHLLKWYFKPEKRSRSWQFTIAHYQNALGRLFRSTVLRQHAERTLAEVYPGARKLSAVQTKLDRAAFPAECPYTLDQILTNELS